ncbi:hypothetical protein ACS0TY_022072 [Phlomoides rotata]
MTGRKKVKGRILPHDIIEDILSRVPVKDLLRFKAVSKQWEATISDPGFAEKHLQQYKKSSSWNLIAWEEWPLLKRMNVAELKNNNLNFLSAIEHSSEYSSGYGILCDCDGIYLKLSKLLDGIKTYVVWNPSCRAYIEFSCPKEVNDSYRSGRTLYGIYYNPVMKDYKVVIADTTRYAVFSCRYRKWNEVKEIEGIPQNGSCDSGVSCNGSFYWPLVQRRGGHIVDFDIICFDWKDEMFNTVVLPEFKGNSRIFNLTSCGGHLRLVENSRPNEMRMLKYIEGDEIDSWMECKAKMPIPYRSPFPICWLSEDEILLDFKRMPDFLLYNVCKNTLPDTIGYTSGLVDAML